MTELVDWAELKTFLTGRALVVPQYLEFADWYKVKAGDNFFVVETKIKKTSPRNADQIDFEDNYKAGSNLPTTAYVVQTEVRSDYSFKGDVLEVDVACPTVGAGPKVSDVDFLLTAACGLTGGMGYFYENADPRDFVEFTLFDKDGVLGPPNTVLKTFLKKWRLPGASLVEIKNASASYTPVGGLYLRTKITHHVESAVGAHFKGFINLDLWVK